MTRRFRGILDAGARLAPAGAARNQHELLLSKRYAPRHELRLFGATLFLTDMRFDEALGFLVAFVQLDDALGRPSRTIYPRIFYKDSSLVWRVGSHFVHDELEYWMGKGDLRVDDDGEHEYAVTAEETTNLPFEIQQALDEVSRRRKRVRDNDAVELVLRRAPSGRIKPYADFSRPRALAQERYAIRGDRPIARFMRKEDPSSLVFVPGYEPDLDAGVVERWSVHSRFFGGELRKVRALSTNRRVQFLFFASPTHTWLNPPQALSTELSTYGVRTIDVFAPDDLSIPGYEYHEDDESQIPAGFAGPPHPDDPHRADASAWLNQLPVIKEFNRRFPASPSRARGRGSRARARSTGRR